MDFLPQRKTHCPCCGAPIELSIDVSVTEQDYIEDCSVCCQPMRVRVDASDPEYPSLNLEPESA